MLAAASRFRTRRPRLLAAAFVACVSLAACGDDEPSGPSGPFDVSIARDSLVVMAGDTVHVSATVADTAGATVAVRPAFTSSDTAVARVNRDGVVTGRSAGEAEIVVAAGGDTARVAVTVTPGAASISLGSVPDSTVPGMLFIIAPVAFDSAGEAMADPRPLSFETTDSSVATVDSAGRVWVTGIGDASIRVRIGPFTGELPVRGRLARMGSGAMWKALDGGSDNHACALSLDGAAWCWGEEFNRRLGSEGGTTWQPRAVTGNLKFERLATGHTHNCGLDADSVAWCWGAGNHNQLGGHGLRAFVSASYTPLPEATGRRWAWLVAGGHGGNCALDAADSLVYCWGHNDAAQLGLTRTLRPSPLGTTGTPTLDIWAPTVSWRGMKGRAAALENFHGCMLTNEGAAWCSAFSNDFTAVGAAPSSDSTPWPVQGGHRYTQVAVGRDNMSCGLREDGRVLCWGRAPYLGIGDMRDTVYRDPQPIASTLTFDELQSGGYSVCARSTAGAWWCWGSDAIGTLASGERTKVSFSPVPVRVPETHQWRTIQPSGRFTCGLTMAGEIYCWGAGAWFGPNPTSARSAQAPSRRAQRPTIASHPEHP